MATQWTQLLAHDAQRMAEVAYGDILKRNWRRATRLGAVVAGPSQSTPALPNEQRNNRCVSFRDSPIDLVAESEMYGKAGAGGERVSLWSEARTWAEQASSDRAAPSTMGDKRQSKEQSARDGRMRGFYNDDEKEVSESDGVCLILPHQGSLKRVGIHGDDDAGGGVSLAAALSTSERRERKHASMHRP